MNGVKINLTIHLIGSDPVNLEALVKDMPGLRNLTKTIWSEGCNIIQEGILTFYPPHSIRKIECPVQTELPAGEPFMYVVKN